MSFVAAMVGLQTISHLGETLSSYQSAKRAQAVAKTEGKIAMSQAEAQAERIERQGDVLMSRQLAAAGASGVVPTTGSPAEVMTDTAREIELRKLDELYAGKLAGYEAKIKARDYGLRAGASLLKGLAGTASVLGQNAGVVGSSWNRVNGNRSTTGWASSVPSGRYHL